MASKSRNVNSIHVHVCNNYATHELNLGREGGGGGRKREKERERECHSTMCTVHGRQPKPEYHSRLRPTLTTKTPHTNRFGTYTNPAPSLHKNHHNHTQHTA